MAIPVRKEQRADGGTSYQFGPLRLHLYDTYLIWSKGAVSIEEAQINYSDITSVSFTNGNFIANAAFQISTAGRVYKCRFTCAAKGFEYVTDDINQRRGVAKVTTATTATTATPAASPTQQILEYKQLLDIGAITPEEYEAKKKQLLDL